MLTTSETQNSAYCSKGVALFTTFDDVYLKKHNLKHMSTCYPNNLNDAIRIQGSNPVSLCPESSFLAYIHVVAACNLDVCRPARTFGPECVQ